MDPFPLASDSDGEQEHLLWSEGDLELGTVAGEALWPRRELQDRAPDHSIQSAIAENYHSIGEFRFQILAARFPLAATDLRPHRGALGFGCAAKADSSRTLSVRAFG